MIHTPPKDMPTPFVGNEEMSYSARLGAVTRKQNEIKHHMSSQSAEASKVVEGLLKDLDGKVGNFVTSCDLHIGNRLSEQDKEEMITYKTSHLKDISLFRDLVVQWIQSCNDQTFNMEPTVEKCPSNRDSDCLSAISKMSTSSAAMRLKLTERQIKLESKQKLLQQQAAIKQKRLELDLQAERLEVDNEADEIKSLSAALDKLESLANNVNAEPAPFQDNVSKPYFQTDSIKNDKFDKATKINVNYLESCNAIDRMQAVLEKQTELTSMIVNNNFSSRLPCLEPETFDGNDITKYDSFILSFDQTIVGSCSNYKDLFYFLLKYTAGRAFKLVKSCKSADPRVSYIKARETLSKSFGNPIRINHMYINKLNNWPPIREEDLTSLEEFSISVNAICNMMDGDTSDGLNCLNSWEKIAELVLKLPMDMRKRFRSVVNHNEIRGNVTNFRTFADFINGELNLLRLPLFGDVRKNRFDKTVPKLTLKTDAENFMTESADCLVTKFEKSCLCCGKDNHEMDSCYFFNKKSIDLKEKFIKENRICFGCLSSTSHMTKFCSNKLSCKHCQKRHPTSLHKTYPKSNSYNENNNMVPLSNEEAVYSIHSYTNRRIICPAVPVRIKMHDSNAYVCTYMALDTQSTGSYIDESLLNELNLKHVDTKLTIRTMNDCSSEVNVKLVENLKIESLDGEISEFIPKIYSQNRWPFEYKDSPSDSYVKKYESLKDVPFTFIKSKIGLLVGNNVPEMIKPLEIKNTYRNGPFATKHLFGWAFNGPIKSGSSIEASCYRIAQVDESDDLHNKIERCFSREFDEDSEELQPSRNDAKFLNIVKNSIKVTDDNCYEVNLPLKENISFPDNHRQAYSHLSSLKRRLLKNEDSYIEYVKFMKLMRNLDFVEEVPETEYTSDPSKIWFLTHHAVKHKQKGSTRIVFNCSLKYSEVCLNDNLLQGPDYTNSLVGVLLRFRENKIAFTADIEKMFYCVKVPDEHRDVLRFLWFPNDDLSREPIQYRLKVHVFGARSSPSCANFALRHIVDDPNLCVDETTKYNILNSFYVDDILRSTVDSDNAEGEVKNLRETLSKRGFNLTGFSSNSGELLKTIPDCHLSDKSKLNLNKDEFVSERALGVHWDTSGDYFHFQVNLHNVAVTRRGILSAIFSVFDPLFLISPVVVPAKRIFQETFYMKLGWDDYLPSSLEKRWTTWLNQMDVIKDYKIDRCIKPLNTDNVELHIFCDGSLVAYGCVAYLRCIGLSEATSRIITAKIRMTPLNRKSLSTVPRIELNAARLAVSLYLKLKSDLTITFNAHFWSDSRIVLSYIASEECRFQRFVHNRVSFIRNHTCVDQWHYVNTKINPADLISRGTNNVDSFINDNIWKYGPKFLSDVGSLPLEANIDLSIAENDEEVKSTLVTLKEDSESPTDLLINSRSSWFELKLRIAAVLRVKNYFLHKNNTGPFSSEELKVAETSIWKYLQQRDCKEAYACLSNKKDLAAKDVLAKLSPFVDDLGVMRVGGRLSHASVPYTVKHPPIVKSSHAVKLYVEHVHRSIGHLGRETTISMVRNKLHVIGLASLVKRILHKCISCQKINGRPMSQIMSELPSDRLMGEIPPFTNVGLDYFGPFLVSQGRGKVREKRYGVVFSCLSTRAIHLEVSCSLSTDSFINTLRRFVARRGPVRSIRSDNGTNLVSGDKELKKSLRDLNQSNILRYCQVKEIEWKFQPPSASHFGGVFEREIRTARKIIQGLLMEFTRDTRMTDDILNTLFCEVEDIMNNRPLTAVSDDKNDLEALTPNHIVRINTNVSFAPGIFDREELSIRKRWRQVQHLADVFWTRWKREYIPLLRKLQKWIKPRVNLHEGDLVLLVDQNLPRNLWCTGRILSVKYSDDGKVRSASVKVSRCRRDGNVYIGTTILERPIAKLILLSCSLDP